MAGHHIVWGGGYRHSHDEFRNTPALFFVPANRDLENTNVYIQDEIALADRLKLAVGVRLEDNTYTGLSPLPSARLSWKVNDTNLLWAAVSRALRTPARLDRELWQAQGSTVVLAGGQAAAGALGQAHGRAGQRGQQHDGQQGRRPQPGTERGQQLEVAVAHAFLAGQLLEQPPDGP